MVRGQEDIREVPMAGELQEATDRIQAVRGLQETGDSRERLPRDRTAADRTDREAPDRLQDSADTAIIRWDGRRLRYRRKRKKMENPWAPESVFW